LESEIGVHWTMKCGNDIVEGSAPVPAIAMAPVAADPAYAELSPAEPGDAVGSDAIPPDSFPAAMTGQSFSGGFRRGHAFRERSVCCTRVVGCGPSPVQRELRRF